MNWEWIVALGGGAGMAAGMKALVDTIAALRSGVSARESKRKGDLSKQRDAALEEARTERARANQEQARADWAEKNAGIAKANEQRAREHAAELRIKLIELALIPRDDLPAWPDMEEAVPRSKMLDDERGAG